MCVMKLKADMDVEAGSEIPLVISRMVPNVLPLHGIVISRGEGLLAEFQQPKLLSQLPGKHFKHKLPTQLCRPGSRLQKSFTF